MPLQTTSDMGSETGQLAAVQTSLRYFFLNNSSPTNLRNRQIFLPGLELDAIPAHRSVKSVYNITRERGWRPIWEKELANVKYTYETGKIAAGFRPEDPIHEYVPHYLLDYAIYLF